MKIIFRKKGLLKSPSPIKKVMMDNFFDDFCDSQARSIVVRDKFDTTSFNVDIEDKGDIYQINATLPGVKRKNIDVSYKDRHIIITAFKKNDCIQKRKNILRQEHSWGRISRSILLDAIDETSMKITFKDNLLKIILNKVSDNEVIK